MAKPMRRIENLWPDLDRWENEGGALLAPVRALHMRQAGPGQSGMNTRIDKRRIWSDSDAAGVPAP